MTGLKTYGKFRYKKLCCIFITVIVAVLLFEVYVDSSNEDDPMYENYHFMLVWNHSSARTAERSVGYTGGFNTEFSSIWGWTDHWRLTEMEDLVLCCVN